MRVVPHGRWGLLGRALAAAVIVITCAAATTAVAALLQVSDLVGFINHSKAIPDAGVTLPPPGAPRTILLIGADRRIGENTTDVGNTDTMLLVRLNDSSSTINLLSIPRDLQVNVPGYGTEKLNAAYEEGGPKLLIQTIREDVFPGFQVNNIMVVSFLGFAHLINDIGCVYGEVDERYFNHNDLTGDATDFSNIDLYPGYQRLCGKQGGSRSALAFVRFRHFDNDEVRNARQQDFLRWAKGQFSASYLIHNYTRLARDFGKSVQVDKSLHSITGLIDLFDVLVDADGHQVKTIQFPEVFGGSSGGVSYVYASSPQAEARAYREFLTAYHSKPKVAAAVHHHAHHRHSHHASAFKVPAGMQADPQDGRSQANELGDPGLPIYYPQYIPSDYGYCFTVNGNCNIGFEPTSAYNNSYPRRYEIRGPHKRMYKAWVMSLVYGGSDIATGLFFNVQGLAWKYPPLLKDPSAVKTVNHRKLLIYSQGGKDSTVAWRTRHDVYWIQNTLQNTIPNSQMVAMAATLTPERSSLSDGTPPQSLGKHQHS